MAIGVTTKKNIIPITNGEIIFPKKIPNLNQRIFNGVNNFEFINPNIIKIIDNTIDHILICPSFNNGQKAINKKNIEKTTPKLLFELLLIFIIFYFESYNL